MSKTKEYEEEKCQVFKNMKIRSKMLVSYLAMTLLLIIVGVAS